MKQTAESIGFHRTRANDQGQMSWVDKAASERVIGRDAHADTNVAKNSQRKVKRMRWDYVVTIWNQERRINNGIECFSEPHGQV